MKKVSLDRTWELCLEMWKWISKQKKARNAKSITHLKEKWMQSHHFKNVQADCFFCEYAERQGRGCSSCPGNLVNKRFHCGRTSYHYGMKPTAFYNKIVALNKKRKAK